MEKKEYIERRALDTELQNLVREYNRNCESDESSGAFEALYRLRLAPAADVVEVVRCKDCCLAGMVVDIIGNPHLFCMRSRNKAEVEFDDFCSYGERKDGRTYTLAEVKTELGLDQKD